MNKVRLAPRPHAQGLGIIVAPQKSEFFSVFLPLARDLPMAS
jgi:hypothetical protein